MVLRHGAFENSGGAFIAYGAIMMHLGKYRDALRAGRMGLSFPRRFPRTDEAGIALWSHAILIEHLRGNIHNCIKEVKEAADLALRSGDVMTQIYCSSAEPFLKIIAGHNLSNI